MTTSNNPVSVLEAFYLPQSGIVLSTDTINEGDMLAWDATNSAFRVLASAGGVAGLFAGVAGGANQGVPYVGDAALVALPILGKGCVFFNTTPGETYLHFDNVTIGADAQTIVKSGASSSNRVGFIILDPPATPRPFQATPVPESLAGAAGVRCRVQLEPKFPVVVAL